MCTQYCKNQKKQTLAYLESLGSKAGKVVNGTRAVAGLGASPETGVAG